jgi:DNA polymerase elongation subunit (family B)
MTTEYLIHVFDAVARDQRILRATENEQEVEYFSAPDGSDSDDGGYRSRKPKADAASTAQLVIHLFGKTAKGESVRIDVQGFRPFFYVGLPPCANVSEEERLKVLVEEAVRARLKTKATGLKVRKVEKHKLYGFTGKTLYSFLELSVPSMSAFYETRKLFLDDQQKPKFDLKKTKLDVFEANIDPMLRFFHIQNLNPCGWMSVKGEELETEDGTIRLEAAWEDVKPGLAPAGVVSAPFLHAFWDIECYSHDGEFPVANQGYRRVAKQVYSLCDTADKAADMVAQGFQSMGPLKVPPRKSPGAKPTEAQIRRCLSVEAIGDLWKDRDTLKGKEREARVQALTKAMDKEFGRVAALAGDPIIQIGTVKWAPGMATSEKHIFVLDTCDPVEGAVVHSYKTERELLLAWFAWVIEENFDVFVGYNIFGFDEKYVWQRLEELGLDQEEPVQQMTRLFDSGGEMKLKEKFLSSSALGDNMLYMWDTPGRLRIDLYNHVKRKVQMTSYKLDAVCAAFLSGKLSGIVSSSEKAGHWILKTKQKGDARVGRYVQVLDDLGEDLTDKMPIVGIVQEGIVVDSEEDLTLVAGEAAKWAVVKDDVSPQEIFKLHRGSSKDRSRVAAYCVQDCDLVLELYRKLEVFNEAMSMANVCIVPVSYIFTRGQGIKIESLIFKYCREKNQLIQVLPSAARPGDGEAAAQEDSYEGAIVLDPEPGFYTDAPVGVCDFASLYPSTIISENISHDMLVWTKDFDLEGKLVRTFAYSNEDPAKVAEPGTKFVDIEFDIIRPDPEDTRKMPRKIKMGTRLCRYAQPPGESKGSLPEIVAKLLAARKAKRNEMGKTEDPFKKALLDAEQNAYKITANSLYGQLGSRTFKIRLQDLAASVTAYGRKQILFSKAAIEKFYGPEAKDPRCSAQIVYGDTDSIFVCFNPRNPETGERLQGREAIVETIALTEEAGKFITGALKAPHDFEYDKVFYPFIIFSKKRYVGNKYEESPDEFKETSMGIVLKRRDNAPILKLAYGSAIYQLLNHRNIEAAVAAVKDHVKELVNGKMKLSLLTITKSLAADYAATPPAHKMLADRMAARDPGNAPAAGDRIGFVYIKAGVGQQAQKLQGDRIETPAYIESRGLKYDAQYYIEHQLMNPIGQLFSLLVDKMPGAPANVAQLTDVQKEGVACELLFHDGLNACREAAKTAFVQMMGGQVQTGPATVKKVAAAPAVTKPKAVTTAKVQTTLNFMGDVFADQHLAKKMGQAKRAVKAAKAKADD